MPHRTYRVAQVVGCFSGSGGGVPRAVADYIHAVRTQGVQVTVFTGFNSHLPITPEVFGLRDCDIVASRLLGPSVLGLAFQALCELARRAKEFDLLHLNGAWNLTTFLGARIAQFNSVPYVITAHGHLGEYHFSRHPWMKRLLFRFMERGNLNHAAAMHVTSDWERRASGRAIADSRVVRIPLPVSMYELVPPLTRQEARRKLGLDERGFHVVAFGRIARQKNPLFLLEAFRQAGLGPSARLFFVGPGEQDVKNALVRDMRKYGLVEQVRMVDYVFGENKRAWLAAGDIFALPSHDDNFCISAVEAAASGTHCLVSPYVGAVEYLPPQMVDVVPLEVRLWSDRLRALAASPPVQASLPPECTDVFRREVVGRSWMSFYSEMLGERVTGGKVGT